MGHLLANEEQDSDASSEELSEQLDSEGSDKEAAEVHSEDDSAFSADESSESSSASGEEMDVDIDSDASKGTWRFFFHHRLGAGANGRLCSRFLAALRKKMMMKKKKKTKTLTLCCWQSFFQKTTWHALRPALDARLLGQEVLLTFDIGWVHVIKKETKSRGYTTPSNGMMNPLKYSSCWI